MQRMMEYVIIMSVDGNKKFQQKKKKKYNK